MPTLCAVLLPILLLLAALAPSEEPPAPPVAGAQASLLVERSLVQDRLENDGTVVRVITRSALLRAPAGVAAFGQIGLAYIADHGDVVFDDTTIEKADGRRVTVSSSGAEDINPFGMSGAVPSDIRLRRLTIPGLEPGDRLHFQITQRNRPIFPGEAFGSWSFDIDPVIAPEQVYELDLPAGDRFLVHLRDGFSGAFEARPASAGRVVRRLVRRAPTAPASEATPEEKKAEERTAGQPDVQYTTFRSWPQVGRWWWELARGRMSPDESVKAEAARLVQGQTTPLEKLRALHSFVALKVRYFSVAFGAGRMQPRPAAEVLASRYGDCKDKHALLAALAASVGIEVRPALVTSRATSLVDETPAPDQFDHVVSVARLGESPSDWRWLDSTAALAPAGYLLPTVRGKKALLLDPVEGGRLVDTPDRLPYPTLFRTETRAALDPTGPLRAHVTLTVRGDAETLLRAAALAASSLTPEKRNDVAKALAQEWDKGKADNLTTSEATRTDGPLRIEYDVVHEMGASVFAKPWDLWLPLPDFSLPEAETSVGPEEKAVKLDLPDETVARGECRMPDGMKARPPLAISLDRPFATYRSTYEVEDGVMRVERTLRVRAREVLGKDAAAYEAFREAIRQDRSQEFPIEAWTNASAPASQTAADLHTQAYKLLDQGDGAKAEDLFRRVTVLEPRHAYAWNNLGRALRRQGRTDEALAAFEKAVEVNPFDEYAWANRGDMLLAKGRLEEAERSFEKQIEIAPLRPWAYRSLGALRAGQKRYGEAREFFERATSADPAHAPTWLQLAWACLRDGRAEEGRAAAIKARTLDPSPSLQLGAAVTLAEGPYAAEAGGWAEAAAPQLVAMLDRLDAAAMAVSDVALTAMVAESWRLRGTASLQAGRLEEAERFLETAWDWSYLPEAAVALARLREAQGRIEEGTQILARGAGVFGGPGNPALRALDEAVPDPARREGLLELGRVDLLKARTHTLDGPPAGTVALDVLLFVDARGRVAEVRPVSPGTDTALARVKPRVTGLDLGLAWPDGAGHAHVRRAAIGCSSASPCALVLDLPPGPSLTPPP